MKFSVDCFFSVLARFGEYSGLGQVYCLFHLPIQQNKSVANTGQLSPGSFTIHKRTCLAGVQLENHVCGIA